MASAAITTIINGFAVMTVDATATDNLQNDVIYELSRGVYPDVLAQVATEFIQAIGGTERYTLPIADGARTPLMTFFDSEELLTLRKDEAWDYDQAWRKAPTYKPVGIVFDPEDRTQFSLVPPPLQTGTDPTGQTPTTITAFPAGNVTTIYANTDLTFPGTTYADLQLPVALEVLAREFGRDSDHEDQIFSQTCQALSTFFFLMANPVGKPT